MAEATEAEPSTGAAPSPARPRRKHAINLCCAQSVQVVVEEVARNLEGLGFSVTVVTGAEARAALLGSPTKNDQPTIHVVCVQGSLQERVLKPLRQALATHGGPNHHLFVAVLDLAVPLAMVGQIRRFAEALERPPPPQVPAPGVPVERRSWREHTSRELAVATRSRSSKHVVVRPGAKAAEGGDTDAGDRPRRRPRSLSTRGRAAKISGTSKYDAVTARHAAVPASQSGVRKRRRDPSRLSAAAPPKGKSERVLGIPQPVVPSRSKPPPPPPKGKMARRSSTTLPAVSSTSPPPPPKGKLSSSTSLPAAGGPSKPSSPTLENAPTTNHRPWKDGKPPKSEAGVPASRSRGGASGPSARAPEPDRLRPRPKGFKFTPPGVKAAEVRAKTGPRTTIPAAEVLADGDRTVVQGMLEEVPKTATTLKLDEPPFPESSDRTVVYDQNNQPVERIEPTQITAPPEPPPEAPRPSDEITAPAAKPDAVVAGGTVVGPPPKPTPHLEAKPAADDEAPRKRKTVLYLERDKDGTVSSPSAPTTGKAEVSESSKTIQRAPRKGDVDESAKTLLRNDGKFEDASTILRKAEQSQVPAGDDISRPVLTLDPEDLGDSRSDTRSEPKPKKTVLYGEDEAAREGDEPAIDKGGTKVAAAAAIAEESARESMRRSGSVSVQMPSEVDEEAQTRDTRTVDPAEEAQTRDTRAVDPDEEAQTRDTNVVDPAEEAETLDPAEEAETLDPDSAPRRSERKPAAGRRKQPRINLAAEPRAEGGSRAWIWVVLLLLVGGGGFAAYQAGLLDGLLGRDDGSTIASRAGPATKTETDVEAKASADGGPSESATGATPAAGDGSTAGEPAAAGAGTESEPSAGTGGPAAASTDAETGAEPAEATTTGEEPAEATTGAEPAEPATTGEEPAEPATTGAEPAEATTGAEPTEPEPELTPEEQTLAKAADRREIVMLKTLFASRRQGSATTWSGGTQRCAAFEVDGVKGWRLPHRREMKLLNAVLPLASGLYWTKTVPKDDRSAAYMLDTSNGSLTLLLKQEPTGEVLCVRRRKKPGK